MASNDFFKHIYEKQFDTWKEQDEIERLIRPVTPRAVELFHPNEYYGVDLIVKTYCSINTRESLKLLLPHGVELGSAGAWSTTSKREVIATHIYSNPETLKLLNSGDYQGVFIRAEHPFVLLIRLLQNIEHEADMVHDKRILFLPGKSSLGKLLTDGNYDQRAIENLRNLVRIKNVDVLLPSNSIRAGRNKDYNHHGLRIITCGDTYDPKFMIRFINIVSSYSRVITNSIGSHLFYAKALGINMELIEGQELMPPVRNLENQVRPQLQLFDSVQDFISNITSSTTANCRKQFLGDLGNNQAAWNNIILEAKKQDFFGFREKRGGRDQLSIPRVIYRPIRSLIKNFRNS